MAWAGFRPGVPGRSRAYGERVIPPLFVSHGAPDLLLDPSLPAHRFLAGLGRSLPRPRAIVCASAHWLTSAACADSSARPRTIHDFSGFPPALDDREYPAPGDPALAERVVALLAAARIPASCEPRGLDHGSWVPLALAYPEADVPVVALALQPARGPAHHFAMGQALAPLAAEDVLVLGSGGATHNLRELGAGSEPPSWVREFDAWLVDAAERGDVGALLDYRKRAPSAARNHPSEEHLLPFFVALGAAPAGAGAQTLHRSCCYRVLAMTAFRFGASRT